MIVLTPDEADKVRGLSPQKAGHGLAPVPLKDGRFMLPEDVLSDPAHADARDFLAALPVAPLEKLPVYTDADIAISPEPAEVTKLAARGAIKLDAEPLSRVR